MDINKETIQEEVLKKIDSIKLVKKNYFEYLLKHQLSQKHLWNIQRNLLYLNNICKLRVDVTSENFFLP